jgi:hypothetical protein
MLVDQRVAIKCHELYVPRGAQKLRYELNPNYPTVAEILILSPNHHFLYLVGASF